VLKKAATSLWGPTSQGSIKMWKYLLFRVLKVEVCGMGCEGGIGRESSQVVSAFRCVRRGRRIGVERERVMESWRVA
jgi:hypothetical protein